jgi:cephalosporin-C deacetylase-like acetyl esterase
LPALEHVATHEKSWTVRGGRGQALTVQHVHHGDPPEDSYQPLTLETDRGVIAMRYYAARRREWGALYVGGVGGDFDTPASGLYPTLCTKLTRADVSGLRVQYRDPTNLHESALDVLTGLCFLQKQGVETAAVVGHSFGGAVVVQAAAHSNRHSPLVRAVVTLATQSYGIEPIADLAPRCGALLIHGMNDTVLPPSCSEYGYKLAHDHKLLRLYPGAGHMLDEVATEVYDDVCNWIVERTRPAWDWA